MVEAASQFNSFFLMVRHAERLDDSFEVTKEERDASPYEYDADTPLSKKGK